jgi:hypothetical protein
MAEPTRVFREPPPLREGRLELLDCLLPLERLLDLVALLACVSLLRWEVFEC